MEGTKTEKLLWDDPKFAKLYSSAEKLTGVFGEKLLQQAGIDIYPQDRPLVVLDNCCGTGVVTKALHAMQSGRPPGSFEVTCGDFADAMVRSITQRIKDAGWSNTKALKVDAQDTKLPGDHFTHIFTNFGPMLIPDSSAMLSECNRMLRTPGVCAFTTWKKVGWIDDFRQALGSIAELPPMPADQEFMASFSKGRWDEEDFIKDQLTEHGFSDIRVEAVPNVSVMEDTQQLQAALKPCLAIVYKLWGEETRQKFANQETENKITKWFETKYGEGPVSWHWIALVTTSTKSE